MRLKRRARCAEPDRAGRRPQRILQTEVLQDALEDRLERLGKNPVRGHGEVHSDAQSAPNRNLAVIHVPTRFQTSGGSAAELREWVHMFVAVMQAVASARAIVEAEAVHPTLVEGLQSIGMRLPRYAPSWTPAGSREGLVNATVRAGGPRPAARSP